MFSPAVAWGGRHRFAPIFGLPESDQQFNAPFGLIGAAQANEIIFARRCFHLTGW
jgi:hypothetical protein